LIDDRCYRRRSVRSRSDEPQPRRNEFALATVTEIALHLASDLV
jgi:hypothetical protein